MTLWTATQDFKKVIDSIFHTNIWKSLVVHGVPLAYIDVLTRMYGGQRATLKCEWASWEFDIGRGNRQRDPIRLLLFNAVLEEVMGTVKTGWAKKRWGVQLGHSQEAILTNLRFADNIALARRSLPQVKQMTADVAEESAKVGLELHPAKAQSQHNNIG